MNDKWCGDGLAESEQIAFIRSRIETLEAALRECATAYNGYAAQIIAKQALDSQP